MTVLQTWAGLLLVILALADVFRSLVRTPLREGPFSYLGERIVCRSLYHVFLLTGRRGFLATIGPSSVVARAAMIVLALLFGWGLVFFAADEWILVAKTGDAAGPWERLYYTGYAVSTLGLGDVVPNSVPARLATIGASLTGFTVITFVVGSISPISNVVAARNAICSWVRAYEDATGRGADDGAAFDLLLDRTASDISSIADAMVTLPVRHRVHAESERFALSHAMAVLEAGIRRTGRATDVRARLVLDTIDTILRAIGDDWLHVPADLGPPAADRRGWLRLYLEADRMPVPGG